MRRSPWFLLSVAAATDASACGVCVTAATDLVLPPIQVWMLIAITWFLMNGIIRSITGIDLPLQPKAFGTIAITVAGVLAAGAAFGPLTILPLLLPPGYAFVRSVIQRKPEERALRAIGAVHLLAIVAAIAFTTHTLRTRTDAEYIAQWPASPTGRARFALLRKHEPASLPTYRELLATDDEYLAGKAAERIGEIGDPSVDAPLLSSALQRFRSSSDASPKIKSALEKLRSKRGAA